MYTAVQQNIPMQKLKPVQSSTECTEDTDVDTENGGYTEHREWNQSLCGLLFLKVNFDLVLFVV